MKRRSGLPLAFAAAAGVALGVAASPAAAGPCEDAEKLFQDKQYEAALTLLQPAAQLGDACAQVRLAGFYLAGLGTQADIREAVKWFRRAADQGDTEGQALLGMVLASGATGKPEPVEAYKWLFLAASRSKDAATRQRANDVVKQIAASMTEQQLAQARRQARAWKPKRWWAGQ